MQAMHNACMRRGRRRRSGSPADCATRGPLRSSDGQLITDRHYANRPVSRRRKGKWKSRHLPAPSGRHKAPLDGRAFWSLVLRSKVPVKSLGREKQFWVLMFNSAIHLKITFTSDEIHSLLKIRSLFQRHEATIS